MVLKWEDTWDLRGRHMWRQETHLRKLSQCRGEKLGELKFLGLEKRGEAHKVLRGIIGHRKQ